MSTHSQRILAAQKSKQESSVVLGAGMKSPKDTAAAAAATSSSSRLSSGGSTTVREPSAEMLRQAAVAADEGVDYKFEDIITQTPLPSIGGAREPTVHASPPSHLTGASTPKKTREDPRGTIHSGGHASSLPSMYHVVPSAHAPPSSPPPSELKRRGAVSPAATTQALVAAALSETTTMSRLDEEQEDRFVATRTIFSSTLPRPKKTTVLSSSSDVPNAATSHLPPRPATNRGLQPIHTNATPTPSSFLHTITSPTGTPKLKALDPGPLWRSSSSPSASLPTSQAQHPAEDSQGGSQHGSRATTPPAMSLPSVVVDEPAAATDVDSVPKYRDRSGFLNVGNTCYASSVLTMLLRQQAFVEGLSGFMSEYGNLVVRRRIVERVPIERAFPDDDTADFLSKINYEQDEYADEQQESNGDQRSPTTTITYREEERIITESICPLHHALHNAANLLREPEAVINGVSPHEIADALKLYAEEHGNLFFDYDQHDAHEFFVELLTIIEREALKCMKKLAKRKVKRSQQKRSRDEDEEEGAHAGIALHDERQGTGAATISASDVWINKLFQGSMFNVVACRRSGCGLIQVSADAFVNISVSVPPKEEGTAAATTGGEAKTIKQLIGASLAVDVLSDYKCDRCGSTKQQYQGGCIHKVPKLLVIQLKRFSVSFKDGQLVLNKNDTPVAIAQELRICSCKNSENATDDGHCREEQDTATVVYALKGAVLHFGSSIDAGHYISIFEGRKPPQEGGESDASACCWYGANDSSVRELRPQPFLTSGVKSGCYLLLYEAISTTSTSASPSHHRRRRRRDYDSDSHEDDEDVDEGDDDDEMGVGGRVHLPKLVMGDDNVAPPSAGAQ